MFKVTSLSTALVVLLTACTPSEPPAPTFPGQEWEAISDPAILGFSRPELADLDAHLKTLNTQSLHVSVDGRSVYTYGDVTEVGYIASVRKSILAIMYGKYVKDGTINLESTLAELGIDDVGGLLEIEKKATVRDLISARSGIYHPAANGGDSIADAPERGSKEPGTYFLYNNWDFNASGTIFEQSTGKGIFEDLNTQIALPLGFQDFTLADHEKSGDPEKSQHLAYHMHLSARDLARFGHLMLMEGRWDDKQLIPADWVAESVSSITPNEEMNPLPTRETGLEYGYMWWVFDDDTSPDGFKGAYAGRGHFGQYIAVFPELGMVISHKTKAIPYKTPEEYEQVRVTWDAFMSIVDKLVAARLTD
ncbi:amide hydrolase [Kordiimonas sediminis]|uniref:Amide hydrolase n=1 Tax=Kordiimonas sediminis TaxID=1735581 RepID=A0A919AZ73_9PROT|nr:serine hydrolase [Kordiimonas sediminis]GHF30285.1 amide hydrolase [Kordiimonas sediminis]